MPAAMTKPGVLICHFRLRFSHSPSACPAAQPVIQPLWEKEKELSG